MSRKEYLSGVIFGVLVQIGIVVLAGLVIAGFTLMWSLIFG